MTAVSPENTTVGIVGLGDMGAAIASSIVRTFPVIAFDLRKEAVDNLIAIVRRDRKWNEDGARKQLVQFFEAWGPTDEAMVDGRKRLSSILFA